MAEDIRKSVARRFGLIRFFDVGTFKLGTNPVDCIAARCVRSSMATCNVALKT